MDIRVESSQAEVEAGQMERPLGSSESNAGGADLGGMDVMRMTPCLGCGGREARMVKCAEAQVPCAWL